MLQAVAALHVGVDNLNVVRHVGRLATCSPSSLHNNADLLSLVEGILDKSGLGLTRVPKVKGQADEEMVNSGQVRALDQIGNDPADDAADYGRQSVTERAVDARRHHLGV